MEGRNVRPVPLYKQGKQGHFLHLCHLLLQSQKPPPPSSASKVEREQRSAPVAAATTSAIDLPHRLRHGSEARKGEGRENCEVDRSVAASGAAERAGHLPPRALRKGSEGVVLSLLVDGDTGASAHKGTLRHHLARSSSLRVPFLCRVLLLRALPAIL